MKEDRKNIPEAHGGNVYRVAEELGVPVHEIVDFSASINPLGVPESVRRVLHGSLSCLTDYPDPDAGELVDVLSQCLGVIKESIICGNGSTELIYLIPRALKPRRVLVPAPTFSEYERACMVASGPGESRELIRHLYLEEDDGYEIRPDEFIKAMDGCDMAFLCNPNNPTGRVLSREAVRRIAGAAEAGRCYLVVDEAFVDFVPRVSVVDEVSRNPYLIVLRSMTKFHALTGLRLGYGVFPLDLVGEMKKAKEPWTVNTPAMRAGAAAVKDAGYREQSLSFMKGEKAFFESELGRLGIGFIPSVANFYLLKIHKANEIAASLRKEGILVRDCSSFPGLDGSYVRVAVKSREDNIRLFEELGRVCGA